MMAIDLFSACSPMAGSATFERTIRTTTEQAVPTESIPRKTRMMWILTVVLMAEHRSWGFVTGEWELMVIDDDWCTCGCFQK